MFLLYLQAYKGAVLVSTIYQHFCITFSLKFLCVSELLFIYSFAWLQTKRGVCLYVFSENIRLPLSSVYCCQGNPYWLACGIAQKKRNLIKIHHFCSLLLFHPNVHPSPSCTEPGHPRSNTGLKNKKCVFLTNMRDRELTVCPLCPSGVCQLNSVCLNPSDPPDPQRPSHPFLGRL